MTERSRYNAFIATLLALVTMFLAACGLALMGRSVEAIGIGGALTGLIGLAGVLAGSKPQTDQVEVTNTPDKPVPTESQS